MTPNDCLPELPTGLRDPDSYVVPVLLGGELTVHLPLRQALFEVAFDQEYCSFRTLVAAEDVGDWSHDYASPDLTSASCTAVVDGKWVDPTVIRGPRHYLERRGDCVSCNRLVLRLAGIQRHHHRVARATSLAGGSGCRLVATPHQPRTTTAPRS